jgi:hypothetical protein
MPVRPHVLGVRDRRDHQAWNPARFVARRPQNPQVPSPPSWRVRPGAVGPPSIRQAVHVASGGPIPSVMASVVPGPGPVLRICPTIPLDGRPMPARRRHGMKTPHWTRSDHRGGAALDAMADCRRGVPLRHHWGRATQRTGEIHRTQLHWGRQPVCRSA